MLWIEEFFLKGILNDCTFLLRMVKHCLKTKKCRTALFISWAPFANSTVKNSPKGPATIPCRFNFFVSAPCPSTVLLCFLLLSETCYRFLFLWKRFRTLGDKRAGCVLSILKIVCRSKLVHDIFFRKLAAPIRNQNVEKAFSIEKKRRHPPSVWIFHPYSHEQ